MKQLLVAALLFAAGSATAQSNSLTNAPLVAPTNTLMLQSNSASAAPQFAEPELRFKLEDFSVRPCEHTGMGCPPPGGWPWMIRQQPPFKMLPPDTVK